MSTLKTAEWEENRSYRRTMIVDVPIEILSEIFIHCLGVGHKFAGGLDWSGPQAGPRRFNSDEAPLLLTKVCKLWRAVSLSTQYLWTVLPGLGVGPILPESGKDKLFHMYLTYSGSTPLSIRILVQTAKWNDYTAALLSCHIHRAGQLRILYAQVADKSSSHSLDRLLADHRGMFKSLTHLWVTSHERTAMPPFLDAFEDAPLLRDVSLVCLSRKINLPWSQIKHYHRHVCDIGDVSDILLPCTQLETLDLCAEQIYSGDHGNAQASIFLPQLQRLRLVDGKWTNHQFFNSLHAPLLEAVQIDDIHHTSPVPLSALTTCIVQSYCIRLSSLQLLCSHIRVDELLQLSRLAPGLRELDTFLTPDALQALEFTPTRNNIFHRLARLTVHDVKFCDEMVINICRSRFFPNSNGVGGGSQVEPLQYCEIYPRRTEHGSRRVARQRRRAAESFQDVAESFQDDADFRDILERLWQLKISMVPDGVSETSSKDFGDCFDFLETYEITHPLLLERHNFAMIVGDISRGSPIPPHIRMRASALLAKWGPLMNEYNARDRRWFVQKREDRWYTLVCSPNIEGGFRSKFATTKIRFSTLM